MRDKLFHITGFLLLLCLIQIAGTFISSNTHHWQPDFSGYTPFQWIFEISAWVGCIFAGLHTAEES